MLAAETAPPVVSADIADAPNELLVLTVSGYNIPVAEVTDLPSGTYAATATIDVSYETPTGVAVGVVVRC